MTIEYEVTIEDVMNVQRYTMDPKTMRAAGRNLTLVGLIGAGLIVYFEWRGGWPLSLVSLLLAFFNVGLLYFGLRWLIKPRSIQQPLSEPLKEPLRSQMMAQPWAQGTTGPMRLTIDDTGLTEERGRSTTVHDWGAVKDVMDAPLHVVITLEGCPRIIVPKSAVSDIEKFVRLLRTCKGEPAQSPP